MKQYIKVFLACLIGLNLGVMQSSESKKFMQKILLHSFSTSSKQLPLLYLPEGDKLFQKNQEIYEEFAEYALVQEDKPFLKFCELRYKLDKTRSKFCSHCNCYKPYARAFTRVEWALQTEGFDEAIKMADEQYKIFLKSLLIGTTVPSLDCSDSWIPCSHMDLKFKLLKALIEAIYSFWPVNTEGTSNGWEVCDAPEKWYKYQQLKMLFMNRGTCFFTRFNKTKFPK